MPPVCAPLHWVRSGGPPRPPRAGSAAGGYGPGGSGPPACGLHEGELSLASVAPSSLAEILLSLLPTLLPSPTPSPAWDTQHIAPRHLKHFP